MNKINTLPILLLIHLLWFIILRADGQSGLFSFGIPFVLDFILIILITAFSGMEAKNAKS